MLDHRGGSTRPGYSQLDQRRHHVVERTDVVDAQRKLDVGSRESLPRAAPYMGIPSDTARSRSLVVVLYGTRCEYATSGMSALSSPITRGRASSFSVKGVAEESPTDNRDRRARA